MAPLGGEFRTPAALSYAHLRAAPVSFCLGIVMAFSLPPPLPLHLFYAAATTAMALAPTLSLCASEIRSLAQSQSHDH
jgi:hypothetical protein